MRKLFVICAPKTRPPGSLKHKYKACFLLILLATDTWEFFVKQTILKGLVNLPIKYAPVYGAVTRGGWYKCVPSNIGFIFVIHLRLLPVNKCLQANQGHKIAYNGMKKSDWGWYLSSPDCRFMLHITDILVRYLVLDHICTTSLTYP